MKIEKEFTNDHQVKIVAEFESDLFEQYKHRAARQLSKKTKIPGFRPGKAPYAVIMNQLGDMAISQEAVDLMLEEEYPKVIDEAEIKPSGPGSLEEIKSENPPIFSFLIPLEPEVNLGKYKDLRKDYEPEPLDKKRVDDYIYQLRRNSATIVPSDNPAEEGNLVYLTISAATSGSEEGEEEQLIKDQPQQVLIPTISEESETEWPYRGFTRKVIGKNANDVFEVSHKYPKNHEDEKFQGKKVTFSVKVQSIKTLELPELDGEFLKSLGDYETPDQFKKDLEERMTQDQNHAYNDKYFLELIDQIREVSTIKYPPTVLEKEVEKVLERVESDLKRQNLDLDTYFKLRKTDKEKFIEEEARPAAIHRLERSLVMDAFAESEGLKLDEEKLKSSMSDLMGEIGAEGNLAEIQKQMGNENFANAITMEAANRALNSQIHEKLKQIATGEDIQVKVEEKQVKPSTKVKSKVITETATEGKQTSEPAITKTAKATKTSKPKADSPSIDEKGPEK